MADEELARRVRAARSYVGLTQEDMAGRLDMSPVTYKRIESGKRELSIPEIARVAEITNWPQEMFFVDFAQLVGGGAQHQELEDMRGSLKDLVARLSDLEWQTRQNITGGGNNAP